MGFTIPKTEEEKRREIPGWHGHRPLPGETRKESMQGRHMINYRKKQEEQRSNKRKKAKAKRSYT